MYSCVYLCQNDQSLNGFTALCSLLEKVSVKLLPAEVSSVSYRNDCAALTFLQHIASVLHIDLVNKLEKSPNLGECFYLNTLPRINHVLSYIHRMDDGRVNQSIDRKELYSVCKIS